jgi:hypothetical protein
VHGESVRVKRGEASRSDSTVFDGRRVDLRGVRGETLGLSVRVSEETRRIRLRVPEAAARVESFAVRSIDVREPSSSMYGESRGRGSYPDLLVPSRDGVRTNEQAYFDVAIRPDARRAAIREPSKSTPARSTSRWWWIANRSISIASPWSGSSTCRRRSRAPTEYPKTTDRLCSISSPSITSYFANTVPCLPPTCGRTGFPRGGASCNDVRYWPVALDLSSDQAIAADTRAWIELFEGSNVTPFAIPVDVTAIRRASALAPATSPR